MNVKVEVKVKVRMKNESESGIKNRVDPTSVSDTVADRDIGVLDTVVLRAATRQQAARMYMKHPVALR